MTGDRDLVADTVSDIFDYMRTDNKTGIVSIEYSLGGRTEGGEIHFQAGRPVYARAGTLQNQAALNLISRLQPIYFRLMSNTSHFPVTYGGQTARPSQGFPAHIPLSPLPSDPVTGSFHRESPTTSPLRPDPFNHTNSAQFEELVPQKLAVGQDVLTLPLSRRQRLIYMLIDGHRSVTDLARCTRKNMQEVERILIELQEQHLVSL